jgi:hypothetical protein
MYLADMTRPLYRMPDGSTLNVQVAINRVALLSERPNKTLIYVSGVTVTCDFLAMVEGIMPQQSLVPD